MTVHDTLVLINREISDNLTPDSGNFDVDTLFANSWFEQYDSVTGPFGEVNVLAQDKGTTVDCVAKACVLESGRGKVRQLANYLYTLCDRKKWARDGRVYNELITAWHAVVAALHEVGERNQQLGLDV